MRSRHLGFRLMIVGLVTALVLGPSVGRAAEVDPAPVAPYPWRLLDAKANWVAPDTSWADSTLGWRIGFDWETNAVERTLDGGKTWTTQMETADKLVSVDFVDERHGWVVGADASESSAYAWRTTDGGASWQSVELAPPGHNFESAILWAVDFVDTSTGFAVGLAKRTNRGGSIGVALRTSDGGRTWTLATPLGTENVDLRDVAFVDPNVGWAVGTRNPGFPSDTAVILATRDGGNTWTEQTLPPTAQRCREKCHRR